jgi:phage/plasmid-like protein (TIGR03299 family)
MAHELLIEDGEAAMFYVGEPPWHGLGQKLNSPATAAEAVEAAHLDWRVAKVPLYIAGGSRLHEIRGRYAIVRDDAIGTPACRALGIVGESYRVLQNTDAFRFFDPIVGEGAAVYHTAGALGAGERVWILAKLPGDIMVAGRDRVEKHLLLSNSHDGSSAVQVKFTPVRVVCQNTLAQALAEGRTFRARHDRDLLLGLRDVREAMGFIGDEYARLAAAFDAMARVGMDRAALGAYLSKVFPLPADRDDERASERADAQRFWAAHLFERGAGNTEHPVAGTLWAAYNAVTELVDHGSGLVAGQRAAADGRAGSAPAGPPRLLSPQRCLHSIWFGAGHATKVRAWDEAVSIAHSRGEI